MSSSEPSTLSFPARNQQQPFFAQIVVAVFAVCCGIVLWSHLLFPFAENMFGAVSYTHLTLPTTPYV